LQLESALVISIGQDEEDVLDDAEEVLLEEGVAYSRVCTSKVVDDFETYCKEVSFLITKIRGD
jgi:hypothetical protein